MEKCIGVINSEITNETFGTLCGTRPDYMLPYGGRYRIIDFSLSTITNNKISRVVVYGGTHLRSTLDHIGNGQPWELNRRRNGLFIFPKIFDEGRFQDSDIVKYYRTLPFYEDSDASSIYMDNPMTIVNVNLKAAYEKFVKENLDVLFIYKMERDDEGKYLNTNKLILDRDGDLVNIGVNLGTENTINLFLGKFFIKRQIFIDLVKDSIEKSNAQTLRKAILNNKDKLKIGVMETESHVEIIRDVRSFYEANMNLLKPQIYKEVFFSGNMIYTKSKDEPSAIYMENSKVNNSLIANGCMIDGFVDNSIVFRGVKIGKNTIVRNSIIMQKSIIGSESVVVNCIADKNSAIADGVTVVGNPMAPYIVQKGLNIRKDER